MRVPIPHNLPKEEVRRRLKGKSGEIGGFIPGGAADVTTHWPDEDTMALSVRALGQGVDGRVLIEEGQVVFEVDLPPALSFVEPMIKGAIAKQGQKMLADKRGD